MTRDWQPATSDKICRVSPQKTGDFCHFSSPVAGQWLLNMLENWQLFLQRCSAVSVRIRGINWKPANIRKTFHYMTQNTLFLVASDFRVCLSITQSLVFKEKPTPQLAINIGNHRLLVTSRQSLSKSGWVYPGPTSLVGSVEYTERLFLEN